MKKILFKKFSGAGNDFVLVDQKDNQNIDLVPELVQKICNRRTGVGADGILEIKDVSGYDFDLTYYNADGFPGSLCGNGSRCAIKYAGDSGRITQNKTLFICDGTEYKGEVLGEDLVKFYLNQPEDLKKNIEIKFDENTVKGDFINSGSPHFVTEINSDLNKLNVEDLGKKIRYHETFSPQGTNVNFVQLDGEKVKIRTFERGVEAETLACGTGCVAAATILFLNGKIKTPVRLEVQSGETLTVNFEFNENNFENISLVGPANMIFAGEYYLI
ncbi:MAG: diaminopimelate epimerase [Rhodothermaceae bacterium]